MLLYLTVSLYLSSDSQSGKDAALLIEMHNKTLVQSNPCATLVLPSKQLSDPVIIRVYSATNQTSFKMGKKKKKSFEIFKLLFIFSTLPVIFYTMFKFITLFFRSMHLKSKPVSLSSGKPQRR